MITGKSDWKMLVLYTYTICMYKTNKQTTWTLDKQREQPICLYYLIYISQRRKCLAFLLGDLILKEKI